MATTKAPRIQERSASHALGNTSVFRTPIHSPTTLPHLYGGIAEGGEQTVCTFLRLAVSVALDHVEFCDTVGKI